MNALIKLFLFFALLVFTLGFASIIRDQSKTPQVRKYVETAKPCRKPLEYSIGNIDTRFKVSPEEFKNAVAAAEAFWESNSGLDLFENTQESELRISLIYDERQQQTYEAEEIELGLKKLEDQRNILETQQSALGAEYDRKYSEFKKAFEKYEKRVEEYNEKVSVWNSEGGTSEKEYEKLKKEEKAIKEDFKELKEDEAELNEIAKKANAIVAQENKIISSYNAAITTYRSKFGNSREFEKGIFNPDAGIVIYQFKELSDLKLTLVHELGHMLGIGHVENPQSIMYYMIGEQDLKNPSLTSEDMSALKTACQLN